MRRDSKVDENQAEIVEVLRGFGATVHTTHFVGAGFPDLVAGYKGRNYLIEVKWEDGELNTKQKEWHDGWQGQVAIARNPKEALRIIGVISHENH